MSITTEKRFEDYESVWDYYAEHPLTKNEIHDLLERLENIPDDYVDPICEELHQIRIANWEECNGDVKQMNKNSRNRVEKWLIENGLRIDTLTHCIVES
jgi:Cdc6-like AAA superfamily ATPase